MIVIFKKDIYYKNEYYTKGDKLNISNVQEAWRLNEKGVIEPINIKDFKKSKNKDKEEE